jgi:hypothetical protein
MSEENNSAKRLIEALAQANRLLRNHSVNLRRLAHVVKAQTSPLEAVVFADGPGIEGNVEAVLQTGDVLCWWLYVRSEGNLWNIEATLEWTSGDRQETVRELPTGIASDFDGLLNTLNRTVLELLAIGIPEIDTLR